MGGRNSSRSPARAPRAGDSSRHSLTQQLSRSVTDWLSGEDKNRRKEIPRSDDRRSRPIERSRDTGRGRQRSVSTESSLVSHSRSSSRDSGHSPPSTEFSRSSYTSYASSSHNKSRKSHHHHHHHHHQRRRDRSYSRSRSRSSSRERSQREKNKALKSGLLFLSSVAAATATAAAQKYLTKDGDREDREPNPRDSRTGHHRQRSTNERVQEGAERARDELGGRREGTKSRETAASRYSAERRDPPRPNTVATPAARKQGVPAPNPDLSSRERLGLNNRAGIKTTPSSTAPVPKTSSLRVEPPRSVYHPHYEETQYAAAPEDDDAIWVPVEESITLNSRGETVVETVERRVAPPSEVAARRKKGGEREKDVFRVVQRHQIVDEWDPRWKKY